MSDRVEPVAAVSAKTRTRDRRAIERRTAERREGEAGSPRELTIISDVPVRPVDSAHADPVAAPAIAGADPVTPAAAFAAQVLGQGGQRRGIRGGPPVLEAARATYLNAEYSGEHDRRPPAGKAGRTDI